MARKVEEEPRQAGCGVQSPIPQIPEVIYVLHPSGKPQCPP